MNKRRIFLFWGVMDLLAFTGFIVLAVRAHRVPFYTDVQDFMQLSADHGWYGGLIFGLSMALYLSLLLSPVLFFKGSRLAIAVAYAQIPFRLISAVPSITVLAWLMLMLGVTSGTVIIAMKVLSELIKFLSLHYGCRSAAGRQS